MYTISQLKADLQATSRINELVADKTDIFLKVFNAGEGSLLNFSISENYVTLNVDDFSFSSTGYFSFDLPIEDLILCNEQFRTKMEIRKLEEQKAAEERQWAERMLIDQAFEKSQYELYLRLKEKFDKN